MNAGECELWAGASNGKYGYMRHDGRLRTVHSVVLETKLGRPLLLGHEACHSCDVRLCVNPDHLFEGTRKDNMRDASRKGRIRNQNSGRTHCRKGHPFDPPETYRGKRHCRTCRNAWMRARRVA